MRSVVLFLVGYLLSAVAAESIRETELMDPNVIIDDLIESSGADDEDIYTDYYDEEDSDSFESSGSGQPDDEEDDEEIDYDLDSTMDTPTATLGNDLVEEEDFRKTIDNELELGEDNEIVKHRDLLPDDQEPSNRIPMASTSQSFFSRTEVVIAVVAGAVVGLVFAVIIVLLVMHVRKNKKGDISYDTVKKPIYKKAPTIEA